MYSFSEDDYIYIPMNLPCHLIDGGMIDELYEILSDFEFIEYKIFEISPQALTEDYELALQNLEIDESEDSASLKLISGALNLSLSVLELDRSQVFSHLTGRLLSFDLPRIKSITSQIKKRQSSVAWLCPVQPNLAPPSSYLFRTLLGHTGSVNTLALTKNELDELILISGSSDGTIRTWHLKTGNNIATYAHNAAVQGIVIKNDGKKLISAHRHSVSGAVGGGTSSFSMAINVTFQGVTQQSGFQLL